MKRHQTATGAINYLTKVPDNAEITYALHFIQDQIHILPKIGVRHSGAIASAGFDHIITRCADLGLVDSDKVTVEILTPDQGLQRIQDNHSWDRAVRKIFDDVLMEDVVTVCIRLS